MISKKTGWPIIRVVRALHLKINKYCEGAVEITLSFRNDFRGGSQGDSPGTLNEA